MSSGRDERKTFPDETNYNVGAALGLLAGMGAGLLATVDLYRYRDSPIIPAIGQPTSGCAR
jgi:hypothetical protein